MVSPSRGPNPLSPNDQEASLLLVGSRRLMSELSFLAQYRPSGGIPLLTTKHEALLHLTQNWTDLIISEEKLLDGLAIDLFDEYSKVNKGGKSPVLIVVADPAQSHRVEVMRKYRHIDGLFFKPVDPLAFINTLFSKLRIRQLSSRLSGARMNAKETEVKVCFTTEGTWRSGKVRNIGRGGMQFCLPAPVPLVGARFIFKLELEEPKKFVFEGHGVVRWKKQGKPQDPLTEIGTQFTLILEDKLRELLTLVDGKFSEKSPP